MKFLITASLLNSWQYYMNCREEYEESAKESFIASLQRIKYPTTPAQQTGIDFESNVFSVCDNKPIYNQVPTYVDCAKEISEIIKNGQRQVKVYKDMTIDNIDFFLYGIVDVLKGSYAYDIKYTGNYEAGKFLNSAQHPLYLECLDVPNFAYLISDGSNVWIEEYMIADINPIHNIIRDFMNWLPEDWKRIYFEKWQSK